MNTRRLDRISSTPHDMGPRTGMTADTISRISGRLRPISITPVTNSSTTLEPNAEYLITCISDTTTLDITLPNSSDEFPNPNDASIKYTLQDSDVIRIILLKGVVSVVYFDGSNTYTSSIQVLDGESAKSMTFRYLSDVWYLESKGIQTVDRRVSNPRNYITSIFANTGVTKFYMENPSDIVTVGSIQGHYWKPVVGKWETLDSDLVFEEGLLVTNDDRFTWIGFDDDDHQTSILQDIDQYKLFLPIDITDASDIQILKCRDITDPGSGIVNKEFVEDGVNILTTEEKMDFDSMRSEHDNVLSRLSSLELSVNTLSTTVDGMISSLNSAILGRINPMILTQYDGNPVNLGSIEYDLTTKVVDPLLFNRNLFTGASEEFDPLEVIALSGVARLSVAESELIVTYRDSRGTLPPISKTLFKYFNSLNLESGYYPFLVFWPKEYDQIEFDVTGNRNTPWFNIKLDSALQVV